MLVFLAQTLFLCAFLVARSRAALVAQQTFDAFPACFGCTAELFDGAEVRRSTHAMSPFLRYLFKQKCQIVDDGGNGVLRTVAGGPFARAQIGGLAWPSAATELSMSVWVRTDRETALDQDRCALRPK